MPLSRSADALASALTRSGITRIAGRRHATSLRVLAYHDVADAELFGLHLDLIGSRYRPVSLADVDAATTGAPLPRNAVLITFDDGDRSVLELGAPLLHTQNIPAVVFVVAGLVGTHEPFWWETVEAAATVDEVRRLKLVPDADRRAAVMQLASVTHLRRSHLTERDLCDLEAMGVAVGSHSLTHPILARCDDATIRRELADAKVVLERAVGHRIAAVAYPNGEEDERVILAARELGHTLGFRFDHHIERDLRDPLRISRLRVNSTDPLALLELKMSGVHTSLLRARGRV